MDDAAEEEKAEEDMTPQELEQKRKREKEEAIKGMVTLHAAIRTVRINPEPMVYWGKDERLQQLFAGRSQIVSQGAGEAASTRQTFVCTAHEAVVAEPEFFANVVDGDGVRGVHACALNGYLETLKVLVEEGGADPFAQTRLGGVDTLMIARRRGHRQVSRYLQSLTDDGGARLEEIRVMIEERQRLRDVQDSLDNLSRAPDSPEKPDIDFEARRKHRAQMAKEKALKATAQPKKESKSVDAIPRLFWRAEYCQIDKNGPASKHHGFYPRKPFNNMN